MEKAQCVECSSKFGLQYDLSLVRTSKQVATPEVAWMGGREQDNDT
jgi:hypothetical protein